MPTHFYSVIKYSFLLAPLATASFADATDLNNVRSAIHADYTRVVLDLSESTPYTVSSQEKPTQLEILIEQTNLATDLSQPSFEDTPVIRLRADAQDDASLRLVFDLGTPAITKTYALGPNQRRGDRIVIDFYDAPATSPAINAASAPAAAITRSRGAATPRETHRSPIAFSGTWEQEWAVETDGGNTQKFESLVEPRTDIDLPQNMRLVAIARIRIDTEGDLGPDASKAENYSSINGPWYNDENAEFSLREFYLDAQWGNSFWRLGKQQLVWGQADGIKVMDVVNPQSFREFILDDFDDSRIPLWMAKAELPVGEEGNLQFLWIPDTTYHELAEAGTPYAFTSSRLLPEAPTGIANDILEADKPDNAWEDSDAGLRYSTFLGGWDITLNYMYHYQDFAAPYQEIRLDDSGITAVLAPEYERNHLIGGTLSNVFGTLTLRTEAVYNTDTFHLSSDVSERGVSSSDEFASVIGLDWQVGSHDTLLSAQWFQSHLLDYDRAIYRGQTEHNLSLLYRRTFNNETWNFDALGLYSLDHQDRLLQVKLSYMLRSNLELWLGGDFFGGDDEGLYGQYSEEDRILLGLELGF